MEYIADFDIEKIKEWENNPRKNDSASDNLSKLINKYGFINPVIIDQNGILRAGHTRIKSAKKLGIKSVPAIIVDFKNEQDAIGFAIADNKSHEWSEWDNIKLGLELTNLQGSGFNLEFTGFLDNEILLLNLDDEGILRDNVITVNPPEAPKLKERFGFHFKDINDYEKVKKFFAENNDFSCKKLLDLIK